MLDFLSLTNFPYVEQYLQYFSYLQYLLLLAFVSNK